jgi:hypothetical protein
LLAQERSEGLLAQERSEGDDKPELLRGNITCCDDENSCKTVPASVGCQGKPTQGPKEIMGLPPEEAAQILQESTAPPSWFWTAKTPFLTRRGDVANLFRQPIVNNVFIGSIEAEYGFIGETEGSPRTLVSWCSIRVERVFKGDLRVGERVDILFDGGRLSPGPARYPSEGPRCYPFDFGLYATHDWNGVLRPIDTSFSMMSTGRTWQESSLLPMIEELAASWGAQ